FQRARIDCANVARDADGRAHGPRQRVRRQVHGAYGFDHAIDLLRRGVAIHDDEHGISPVGGPCNGMLSYVAPFDPRSAGAFMNRCCFSALLTLLLIAPLARAENWAQWRGPTGQGYSDDTRAPLKWGDQENLLWKTKLPGGGNSSPIIWGGRIFLTAASPG